MLRLSEL
jgi:hypothetical protein